jgi:hypothetical protein
MPFCCCCGYNKTHGIYLGRYVAWKTVPEKVFACEECFTHPDLFFPAKKILDHWLLKHYDFPLDFFLKKAKP